MHQLHGSILQCAQPKCQEATAQRQKLKQALVLVPNSAASGANAVLVSQKNVESVVTHAMEQLVN